MEPESDPVALRPDFYRLGAAWKARYGFNTPPPLNANGLKLLNDARLKAKAIHGEHYPEWVLHQATIGTMPANRVVMGPGIVPPRFRWVPYADALIFPLDNSGMAAASPDKKQLFAFEDVVGARYLKQAGLTAIPATLGEYLLQVVAATRKRGRTSSEQCRSARLCRIGEVLNGALREIVLTGTLASLENLRAKSSPELAAISAHRGWT